MSAAAVAEKTLARAELVKLLSDALGAEKAAEVVEEEAKQCGLGGVASFTRSELLQLLDKMTATPGLVGIVARFAKVRIILQVK